MPVTIIVSYEVKDFHTWKKAFEGNESARASRGIKAKPYKESGSTNNVYVIGEAPSREIFEEMFGDPKMVDVMKDAGVISKPSITFLEG